MGRSPGLRYGDTAVIFHWLIAVFIIGLLVVGKYMTGLAENDPIRFELTQWHKSFGIVVLLLSVLRIVWRLLHKPPPEPESIARWQQLAASFVHILLYVLMLALPITGWIMVSTSPLNIDTVLFGAIPWPHLPITDLPNKEAIAADFHQYHEYAGMALIVLLLAHVGAALKHHLIDKDGVLMRMLPEIKGTRFIAKAACVATILGVSAALLTWVNAKQSQVAILAAGESEISFIADIGQPSPGLFTEAEVIASINESDIASSSISAVVQTASVTSSDFEVASSLPDEEWFDVSNYPEATFQSTLIEKGPDDNVLVTGDLTLKSTTQSVNFPMSITVEDDKQVARGEFSVDRREFSIGMDSHADDEYVGFDVIIRFRFEIISSPQE